MRILFLAMSNSIHTARWIEQIADQGWDIHLLSSLVTDFLHPDLRNVTVHHDFLFHVHKREKTDAFRRFPKVFKFVRAMFKRIFKKYYEKHYRVRRLSGLIRRLRPDIVHALEFQSAAYLVTETKKRFTGPFPRWIATNWGSDIYLFGRLSEHAPKIREVLASCDYYSCECERDVVLARQHGLTGKILPVFPNSGGFDFEAISLLRQPGPASSRRLIMLKGYQNWAGRALVGLRALERCADILKGYQIAIFSAANEVVIAAEIFGKNTGIPIMIVPNKSLHRDILCLHGRARISIGISISDAISTSLLEAMVMGSFPIQTWTACADEWIIDGETGILVPPDDPEIIEKAIRKALTDDDLVDKAAKKNCRVIRERADHTMLKAKTIAMYKTIAEENGILI